MPRLDHLDPNAIAFKLLVTPRAASAMIGKGGQEIAKLKKEYSVACHIHGVDNLYPNTSCQVAVMFGGLDNLAAAFEVVVAQLFQADEEFYSAGDQGFAV